MRGPDPKHKIELTPEEERGFRQLAKARKTPHGERVRIWILLLAYDHPDWSNQQIAREAGCTDRTVREWRRRWATERRSIADLPRPGAPRRFSPRGASSGDGGSL